MHPSEIRHPLRIVIASTGSSNFRIVDKLIPRLASEPNISLKIAVEPRTPSDLKLEYAWPAIKGLTQKDCISMCSEDTMCAAELCEWADILCLAPIDAHTLPKLLSGMTDTFLLEIVRSWDVSKRILLIPAMSTAMWENPMSKKQLSKLRRKWNWVRVMQPLLWHFGKGSHAKVLNWDVVDDIVETIRNQVDLLAIENECSPPRPFTSLARLDNPLRTTLPAELWTIILNHTGDWELAQSLHIYTNLPRPLEWQRPILMDTSQRLMKNLEWAILTGTIADVKALLSSNPTPKWLSHLCVKLTVKFSNLPLLSYLEESHETLFEAFRHKRLPTLASATFGRVDVLDWWHNSISFLVKEYTAECLDGASRMGFIPVLDWWRASGLPLRYSEAALEQASSHGDLEVLEWWRGVSEYRDLKDAIDLNHTEPYLQSLAKDDNFTPLSLKVGKSVIFAAQHNQVAALRWWDESGIPYAYGDQVVKIASACGFEHVLQLWKELKGEKMVYDNQVLVAATKNGHANVLEWWKCSGFRVEYKTCDIEEALEDSVSGRKEEKVRQWWARNGLNLGISTSEWTKSKLLG